MKISKVVIPAAGLGTRLLPITKSIPKEMLPVKNKPAIEYNVLEAKNAGIENLFIVLNSSKSAISNYFDYSPSLDIYLKEKNKSNLIKESEDLRKSLNFAYINQDQPLGTGHAVNIVAPYISKEEYFAVMFPDDILLDEDLSDLKRVALENRCSVIAVIEVPKEKISSYGVISFKNSLSSNLFEISGLVEKPKSEDAPSNLAIIGRYILSSKIFYSLKVTPKGASGEYQLTDAIMDMMLKGERILAYKISGRRFDVGTPEGLLQANIELSL